MTNNRQRKYQASAAAHARRLTELQAKKLAEGKKPVNEIEKPDAPEAEEAAPAPPVIDPYKRLLSKLDAAKNADRKK